MKKLKVAVLMGGISSEREVSLSTGGMIMEALDRSKYEAYAVDAAVLCGVDPGTLPGYEKIKSAGYIFKSAEVFKHGSPDRPDVIFLALHGKYGEDGTVQGFLELLGIPYTGSGVLGSALAMDKIMAKQVLRFHGIRVPGSVDVLSKYELMGRNLAKEVASSIGFPVIVKPSRQGSTIGAAKIDTADKLMGAISEAMLYDENVLIEEFISGIEITAALLGNDNPEVLPLVEIVPKGGFYDYEAKYTPGATDEIVPARIPEDIAERAREIALSSHKALRCRGMSRVDMIIRNSDIFVLELNTIPGMTPTSLLPTAAKAAGIDFPELLDKLIGFALEGREVAAHSR